MITSTWSREVDEAKKLAIIYQDIQMATQEEVNQAAKGTVFEGSYPADQDKQLSIIENLRFMASESSDAEAKESCLRVLDQALLINQKLSW